MKKIGIIFILIVTFFSINKVKALDNTLKIYDYAQVLTTSEEEKLKEDVYKYIKNYNMDMVLVTVRHHFKNTTKEYAEEFYNYNDFGLGNNKDGILFVIDFNFGNAIKHIFLSGEAYKTYNEQEKNNILDDIDKEENKGYYYMFKKFINDSNNYINIDILPDDDINNYNKSKNVIPIAFIFIISIVISIFIMSVLISKNKTIKSNSDANYYLNKDSVEINKRLSKFITTHTTSVRINDITNNSNHSINRHLKDRRKF